MFCEKQRFATCFSLNKSLCGKLISLTAPLPTIFGKKFKVTLVAFFQHSVDFDLSIDEFENILFQFYI